MILFTKLSYNLLISIKCRELRFNLKNLLYSLRNKRQILKAICDGIDWGRKHENESHNIRIRDISNMLSCNFIINFYKLLIN